MKHSCGFPQHCKRNGTWEKTLSKTFLSINKLLELLLLTAKSNQSNFIQLTMFFIVQRKNSMLHIRCNSKKQLFLQQTKYLAFLGKQRMFIGTVLLFESYSKPVESERLDFPQVCAESENTVSVCLATFIKKQEAQETDICR